MAYRDNRRGFDPRQGGPAAGYKRPREEYYDAPRDYDRRGGGYDDRYAYQGRGPPPRGPPGRRDSWGDRREDRGRGYPPRDDRGYPPRDDYRGGRGRGGPPDGGYRGGRGRGSGGRGGRGRGRDRRPPPPPPPSAEEIAKLKAESELDLEDKPDDFFPTICQELVGISSWRAEETPGFLAEIRKKTEDFVVQEIDTEGNVATMEEPPPPTQKELMDPLIKLTGAATAKKFKAFLDSATQLDDAQRALMDKESLLKRDHRKHEADLNEKKRAIDTKRKHDEIRKRWEQKEAEKRGDPEAIRNKVLDDRSRIEVGWKNQDLNREQIRQRWAQQDKEREELRVTWEKEDAEWTAAEKKREEEEEAARLKAEEEAKAAEDEDEEKQKERLAKEEARVAALEKKKADKIAKAEQEAKERADNEREDKELLEEANNIEKMAKDLDHTKEEIAKAANSLKSLEPFVFPHEKLETREKRAELHRILRRFSVYLHTNTKEEEPEKTEEEKAEKKEEKEVAEEPMPDESGMTDEEKAAAAEARKEAAAKKKEEEAAAEAKRKEEEEARKIYHVNVVFKAGVQREDYTDFSTGDYAKFAMTKTNRNTSDVIGLFSHLINAKKTDRTHKFSVASHHDTPGVTTQFVTGYHVQKNRLMSLVKRDSNCNRWQVKVAGFDVVSKPLVEGDFGGNQFTLVLRGLKPKPEAGEVADVKDLVGKCIKRLSTSGFVNYFGVDEFGRNAIPTHFIGRALLAGDYKTACAYILMPRGLKPDAGPQTGRGKGEGKEVQKAREYFRDTRDVKGALARFPKYLSLEHAILRGLEEHGANAFAQAVKKIPRTVRDMFERSYLCYVWNHMVTARLELDAAKPVVGDLVFIPKSEQVEDPPAEDTEAPKPPKPLVRALTAKDIASKKFTLNHVVLPLPGKDAIFPENSLKDKYASFMATDGVSSEELSKDEAESIQASYRLILGSALEVKHEFVPDDPPEAKKPEKKEGEETAMETEEPAAPGVAVKLTFKLPPNLNMGMLIRELLKKEEEKKEEPKNEKTEDKKEGDEEHGGEEGGEEGGDHGASASGGEDHANEDGAESEMKDE